MGYEDNHVSGGCSVIVHAHGRLDSACDRSPLTAGAVNDELDAHPHLVQYKPPLADLLIPPRESYVNTVG